MSPQKPLERNNSNLDLVNNSKGPKPTANETTKQNLSPNKLQLPQQTRKDKNQRKYSEQLFKAKSVDALAGGMKKICGSNIYQQDSPGKLQINIVPKRKVNDYCPESPKKLGDNSKHTK